MVIIHPEYALLLVEINDLKNEIANLIVERDWLICYACKEVRIDYTLKIGSLEYKLYLIEKLLKQRKMEHTMPQCRLFMMISLSNTRI